MIMSIYELDYLDTNYGCDIELCYRVIDKSLGGIFAGLPCSQQNGWQLVISDCKINQFSITRKWSLTA